MTISWLFIKILLFIMMTYYTAALVRIAIEAIQESVKLIRGD
jgi:hypothetical protein